MNHDELNDAIPAFALDAVSAYEEIKLRDHLELCDECAELADVLKHTAGELALVAPAVRPSPLLRERILAEAERTAQVVPINLHASRGWSRKGSAVLVAASVVSAAMFGGWMLDRVKDQDEQIERQGQAFSVVNSPEVNVVSMTAASGSDGPTGQVFVSQDSHGAAVLISGLQDPGSRSYALWVIRDGKPVALQNFEPNEKGMAVLYVDRTINPDHPMAVTLEPRTGTRSPEGPKVLSSV